MVVSAPPAAGAARAAEAAVARRDPGPRVPAGLADGGAGAVDEVIIS